jgi:hypothetical protein
MDAIKIGVPGSGYLPLLLVISIFEGVIPINRRRSRSWGLWIRVFGVWLLNISVGSASGICRRPGIYPTPESLLILVTI